MLNCHPTREKLFISANDTVRQMGLRQKGREIPSAVLCTVKVAAL
jgi:hypothetical protein